MPLQATHRTVLRIVTAIVVLVVATLLAGCGASGRPTPQTPTPAAQDGSTARSVGPAPPTTAGGDASTTMVMVIRHGEKPDGEEPGIDAAGKQDDSSLTRIGWERAHRLVDLFDPAQGTLRPGLARPKAIYAAGANDDGEGQRTRETVEPLSAKLGIATDTRYGKGDEEELVKHVLAQPGPTLISWQHGEIPAIAEAFPSVTPTPPSEWPDDRFDVVWTFTKTTDGWHFAQVAERVLPQDKVDVIEE